MKRLLPIIFFINTISLAGCEFVDNANQCETGSYPFVGCWVTTNCVGETLTSGIIPTYWLRSQYDILENGSIKPIRFIYANSECTILDNTKTILQTDIITEGHFSQVKPITLTNGLAGYEISMSNASSGNNQTVSARLTVTDDHKLCLSPNVRLESEKFYFTSFSSTEIDYAQCLQQGTLP